MSEPSIPEVLIVDDDDMQRDLMSRLLSSDYSCAVAGSVAEARTALATRNFSLLICDVNMPGESGLALVRELSASRPDIAVTMVTAVDDPAIAEKAIKSGALDYIVKPYRATELRIGVANSLRRRELEREAHHYVSGLEDNLLKRTAQLRTTLATLDASRIELEESRLDVIQRLSLTVEARDCVTAKHVNGMIDVVTRFALEFGQDTDEARALGIASSMHDVGKIGVADAILLKPGPLTPDERASMQQHCEIGFHILDGSPNHVLQLGATVALAHHERFDGDGYPNGLAGRAIPEAARIVQIVDVYSALTSDRPYRLAMPHDVALQIIREGAGSQFDPQLVDLFCTAAGSILEIDVSTRVSAAG